MASTWRSPRTIPTKNQIRRLITSCKNFHLLNGGGPRRLITASRAVSRAVASATASMITMTTIIITIRPFTSFPAERQIHEGEGCSPSVIRPVTASTSDMPQAMMLRSAIRTRPRHLGLTLPVGRRLRRLLSTTHTKSRNSTSAKWLFGIGPLLLVKNCLGLLGGVGSGGEEM